MDGCDWNCELTQRLWKRDDWKSLLQRNIVSLKILDHRKWPPETMTVSSQMYDCKRFFEIIKRIKEKYLPSSMKPTLTRWEGLSN